MLLRLSLEKLNGLAAPVGNETTLIGYILGYIKPYIQMSQELEPLHTYKASCKAQGRRGAGLSTPCNPCAAF